MLNAPQISLVNPNYIGNNLSPQVTAAVLLSGYGTRPRYHVKFVRVSERIWKKYLTSKTQKSPISLRKREERTYPMYQLRLLGERCANSIGQGVWIFVEIGIITPKSGVTH